MDQNVSSTKNLVYTQSLSHDQLQNNRAALARRLQFRRPRQDLINQGIMPAVSAAPIILQQKSRLEKAKKIDNLQRKIRVRPDRNQLIQRHILEDSNADPSIQVAAISLKRKKLQDNLNERLLMRPGPLELVNKNILHPNSIVGHAIKEGAVEYADTKDSIHIINALSPPESLNDESPQPSPDNISLGSPSSPLFHPASHFEPPFKATPQLATTNQSMSNSIKPKDVTRRKKQNKSKFKKYKYHEYRPPNMEGNSSKCDSNSLPADSPYALLLEQQQKYLQLQVLCQNYPQTFLPLLPTMQKTDQVETPPAEKPMKIEEMRVIDLRNELKSRGLPVSGSKNNLMERLKSANAQGSGNSSNITSSVTQITQTTPVPVAPRTTLTRSTSVPNGVSLVNSLGTAKILNDAEKMLQEQNISVDEIQQKIQQLQHLNLQLQLQHLDIKNQQGKPLQPTSQAAVQPASQLSNLPVNQTGSFSQANGQRETVTSQEQNVGETIKKHVQQLKHINSPPQQQQHLQNNKQIQQVQQQELQQQQQQQLQQQQQQLQQRQQQLQQPQLKQQQHAIAKHAPLEHKKQLQQRQLQLKQLEHQQQYQQHIKQQQLQQQQMLQLQQQQQQQQRLQTNNQLNQQHLLYNHLATSQASIDMKTKVSENNVVTSLPPPQQCQVSISGTPLLHSSPLVCNTNCNGTQLQQSSESTAPNVNSVQLHNVIHFKQPGKPVIFLQRPKQQQQRAQRLFSPTEKQFPSDLSNDIFFQQMTRPNSLSLHHSDVNMEQESNWTSLIEGETRSSSSSPTPVERSPPPYFEAVAGRLSPRSSSNGPFPKLHSRTSSVSTLSSLGHRRSLSVPTVNNSSGLPQEMQKEQQKSGSAMCLDFPEAEEMNNIADNYHGITQELQKAMMIESQNSPDNHNADLLDILGVDTRISSSATAGDGLTSSISNGYSQSSLPVSSSSVEASTSFTHPNSPKPLKSPTTSLPSYQEAVQNTICASSPAAVNFNSSELLSEMHEHSAPLNIIHSQPKMASQIMDGCLLTSCNSPMRVDEDDVDLRNVLYANGYRRDSFDNLRTHTMHNTSIYHVNPCDIFGNSTDGGLIKQGEAGLAFIDVDTGNSEFPESMDLGGNNDSGISVNGISGITFSQ